MRAKNSPSLEGAAWRSSSPPRLNSGTCPDDARVAKAIPRIHRRAPDPPAVLVVFPSRPRDPSHRMACSPQTRP